jgi:hypothetical protein
VRPLGSYLESLAQVTLEFGSNPWKPSGFLMIGPQDALRATNFRKELHPSQGSTSMTNHIKINVYKADGNWFTARWVNREFDGSDPLDISPNATSREARQAALEMPLTIQGEREIHVIVDFLPCPL